MVSVSLETDFHFLILLFMITFILSSFFENIFFKFIYKKFQSRISLDKNYNTTFGVNIATCSDGAIYIYEGDSFYESKRREVTIDELKYLLSRYEELDKLVEKITEETNIVC